MRPRRFTARGHPRQGQRRHTWGGYQRGWRWWRRRGRFFASGNANTTCPGCHVPVGQSDDVHHLAYPAIPGTERDEELLVMCRDCHESVHASLDAWPGLRRMSRDAATWLVIEQLRRNEPTPAEPSPAASPHVSTPFVDPSTPPPPGLSTAPQAAQASSQQTGDTR